MKLLVSDANILIDIEEGEITELAFQLPYQYITPDLLYEEELKQQHSYLLEYGLQPKSLNSEAVIEVTRLSAKYAAVSSNDLSALALARQEQCPLLTGDDKLRRIAKDENQKVNGTLWLMEQMHKHKLISIGDMEISYSRMLQAGRRLPENEIGKQIKRLNKQS